MSRTITTQNKKLTCLINEKKIEREIRAPADKCTSKTYKHNYNQIFFRGRSYIILSSLYGNFKNIINHSLFYITFSNVVIITLYYVKVPNRIIQELFHKFVNSLKTNI